VVLGEQHRRRHPRAATPTWLSILERGLYTGILVVGAIGSGKTSACKYPYWPAPLFRYAAQNEGPPKRGGPMKRSKFSHEQILAMTKEARPDANPTVTGVYRSHRVSGHSRGRTVGSTRARSVCRRCRKSYSNNHVWGSPKAAGAPLVLMYNRSFPGAKRTSAG
jgi:hypothetical protein